MKPPPKDWPRLSFSAHYKDPAKAIDWLCNAFGFEVRLKVEGEAGRIEHSELVFGEAVVMISHEKGPEEKGGNKVSPLSINRANTAGAMFYIDDVDAHCARSRAAGGKITYEPAVSDYGADYWADKSYEVEDPEGHRWWFCQRMRTGA